MILKNKPGVKHLCYVSQVLSSDHCADSVRLLYGMLLNYFDLIFLVTAQTPLGDGNRKLSQATHTALKKKGKQMRFLIFSFEKLLPVFAAAAEGWLTFASLPTPAEVLLW